MAKLIYGESKAHENVVKDKASPNGVRLIISRVRVELWRFRMGYERRYLLRRLVWTEEGDYLCGNDPTWTNEWFVGNGSEPAALRAAIAELDDYSSKAGMPHADMSEHPAYRDAAPAAVVTIESAKSEHALVPDEWVKGHRP